MRFVSEIVWSRSFVNFPIQDGPALTVNSAIRRRSKNRFVRNESMSKRSEVVWAVMFILGASCSLAAQNAMPQGTIEATATIGITNGLGSVNHFTVNFGGGARIYFTPSWGLRPEFKIAHIPNETWVRTSVGLFFQFGK